MSEPDRRRALVVPGTLFFVTLGIAAFLLDKGWRDQILVYDFRAGVLAALDNPRARQEAADSAVLWSKIIAGTAALSLAAFCFILNRGKSSPRPWQMTLLIGLVLFLVWVGILISTLKEGVQAERAAAIPLEMAGVVSAGLMVSAALQFAFRGKAWRAVLGSLLGLIAAGAFLLMMAPISR